MGEERIELIKEVVREYPTYEENYIFVLEYDSKNDEYRPKIVKGDGSIYSEGLWEKRGTSLGSFWLPQGVDSLKDRLEIIEDTGKLNVKIEKAIREFCSKDCPKVKKKIEKKKEKDITKKRKDFKEKLHIGFVEQQELTEDLQNKLKDLRVRETEKAEKCKITYSQNNYSYNLIKSVMKEEYNKTKMLNFIINQNCSLRGKITNAVEDGITEIPLLHSIEIEEKLKGITISTSEALICFGERIPKESKILNTLTTKFYLYKMLTKEKGDVQRYTLLSPTKLDPDDYLIDGMELELDDFSDVSKYTRLLKKTRIIIVNNVRSARHDFKNNRELLKILKERGFKKGEEMFMKQLFSVSEGGRNLYFGHPNYFQRLVASFLLSAEYDSSPYPLNLMIIGHQGGGKSKAMEAIHQKMDEVQPIVEGSGSTMKSLIPSFNGDQTKPGALIEASRMVFVDEFFRILMRVDKDERENQLTHLNPLLEHKQRRFGSGNNYLDGKMTARLFAVTNPIFGTSNMSSLSNKMDNSFLSRIFIWYQDEQHYKQVTAVQEDEVEVLKKTFDKDLWLSIFDYCTSKKATFDHKKVINIYENTKFQLESMPESVKGIYNSRYKHHIFCLMDGLVKLNAIINRQKTFEATPETYDWLSEIWQNMIKGWKKGIESVSFGVREERYYGND
jgi:hypothetical protein